MSETPFGTPTQRTLAAIIFTDAVGFSARMQKDEVGTLKLLQRDFVEMRRICAEHEGTVLKTTGDGLLMTFSSAVHAVACALAMQRQFASEAKDRTSSKVLLHRIGIHLGDILVQAQDVMGDGVNIASRLQAEAEPGGICISQTVYDVVKNKIALSAVSLGARDLKNITQAVPAYRILLEAQALHPGSSAPPMAAPVKPAPKKSGNKLVLYGGIAAALVVVFVAGTFVSRWAAAGKDDASSGSAAPAAAAAAQMPRSPEEEALEAEFAKRKEMLAERTQFLDKYDFEGYARALGAKTDTPPAARAQQQAMIRSASLMGSMKDWLKLGMQRYTRQKPLLVHDLSGDPGKDTSVFFSPDKRLVYLDNGVAKPPLDWPDIKPPAMGAIIVSALKEIKQQQTRDILLGAQAFARIYNVPSMLEAIPALPGARQGAGQGQVPGAGQGRIGGQGPNRGRAGIDPNQKP